jgi:hypothetical protein
MILAPSPSDGRRLVACIISCSTPIPRIFSQILYLTGCTRFAKNVMHLSRNRAILSSQASIDIVIKIFRKNFCGQDSWPAGTGSERPWRPGARRKNRPRIGRNGVVSASFCPISGRCCGLRSVSAGARTVIPRVQTPARPFNSSVVSSDGSVLGGGPGNLAGSCGESGPARGIGDRSRAGHPPCSPLLKRPRG